MRSGREQAVQDLHQPNGRQRRLFRRLEDDRVARRERGDLACREHERVVEGKIRATGPSGSLVPLPFAVGMVSPLISSTSPAK